MSLTFIQVDGMKSRPLVSIAYDPRIPAAQHGQHGFAMRGDTRKTPKGNQAIDSSSGFSAIDSSSGFSAIDSSSGFSAIDSSSGFSLGSAEPIRADLVKEDPG